MTNGISGTETRHFTVASNIIYSLIQAQAGTLGKAFLECIMNSIDAQATKIDITFDMEGFTVIDDGCGFNSRDEIEQWFEVFGFNHDHPAQQQKVYAQFGIGRGQLWAFALTQWRTSEFLMDVDIKHRGLNYELQTGLLPVAGVTLTGQFYEKLLPSFVAATERELVELAAYAQIPVTVNGKLISRDPTQEKWEHDTELAWIRLKETGDLVVYHLGALVRKYPGHMFGSGGVVVTKPGVRLALNMARNDILLSQCPVWKKIRPYIQRIGDERMAQKVKLSDDERANLALRIKAGEIDITEHRDLRIFSDVSGRHCSLQTLIRAGRPIVAAPDDNSLMADRIHQLKLALVLTRSTLDRFQVGSMTELKQALLNGILPQIEKGWGSQPNMLVENPAYRLVCNLPLLDDFDQFTHSLRDGYDLVSPARWTAEEKRVVAALRAGEDELFYRLKGTQTLAPSANIRALHVGLSDLASAWTDGVLNIVLERRLLKEARVGLLGFYRIVLVIIHEYLHDEGTAGSHQHDAEFYQRFHSFITDGKSAQIVAARTFKKYVELLERDRIRISKKLWGAIDQLSICISEEVNTNSSV